MCGLLIYTARRTRTARWAGCAARRDRTASSSAHGRRNHRLRVVFLRPAVHRGHPLSSSESLNLAACHACMLLPETSCEKLDRLLDRAVLVGLPAGRGAAARSGHGRLLPRTDPSERGGMMGLARQSRQIHVGIGHRSVRRRCRQPPTVGPGGRGESPAGRRRSGTLLLAQMHMQQADGGRSRPPNSSPRSLRGPPARPAPRR